MIGLYIIGSFRNVKGVSCEQTYPLLLRCTACGTEHAKYVSGQPRRTKGEEKGLCEARVVCKCGVTMSVTSRAPKGRKVLCTDAESKKLCSFNVPPFQEGFLVSVIHTFFCEAVEVPCVEIDVLTVQDILFKDIPIEDGSWTGVCEAADCAQIDSCRILLRKQIDTSH